MKKYKIFIRDGNERLRLFCPACLSDNYIALPVQAIEEFIPCVTCRNLIELDIKEFNKIPSWFRP